MALGLTIPFNELIVIGDAIITVRKYKGNQCRVIINAPMSVKVSREKVLSPEAQQEIKEKFFKCLVCRDTNLVCSKHKDTAQSICCGDPAIECKCLP